MSPADLNSTRLQDWEFVAKFFLWMEHQIHPKRKSNLFHYHLRAINKWMRGLLDRLRPHSLVTEVKSIHFLSLPNVNAGNVALGRSQDPEVDVLLIIAELKPKEVHSRPACIELSFHMCTSRSTAFDVLLRKFTAAPSPGEKYLLDGEKCARLARALWMYVLPYKVRKSLKDKRFGQPYPAPLTFHRFNGMEISSEEELSLVLLPKILPKVPEAEADSLDEFLEIVRDHPLLKYFDPTNELYRLYKEVSDASERYLTPDIFNVSCLVETFYNFLVVIIIFRPQRLELSSEPESKEHFARKSKD
ncbi:hypothetical protein M413DRAFT_147230 [Hebeloma cylindrosporum]|uniref:Uncharacterized protein n=1 Tax=Hebeloma cylindrosporum TaxID=76867 RepID=A0A0C3BXN0_HEBCY|nr:hypothetical protein M413DRAFT_147230 [Hebeloma cylindrosporum h7]